MLQSSSWPHKHHSIRVESWLNRFPRRHFCAAFRRLAYRFKRMVIRTNVMPTLGGCRRNVLHLLCGKLGSSVVLSSENIVVPLSNHMNEISGVASVQRGRSRQICRNRNLYCPHSINSTESSATQPLMYYG